MPSAPIQVVLNADSFHIARERDGGGGSKDFFSHRDEDFSRHKQALIDQATRIKDALTQQSGTSVGVAKVHLRKEALAKSHRPTQVVFRPSSTPVLGGDRIGDLLFQVSPDSLERIIAEITNAESETRMQEHPVTGKEKPHPTRRKSEVGAIERIDLYSQSDKRAFSAEQAVRWFLDPRTGGIYHIDLFKLPPPQTLKALLVHSAELPGVLQPPPFEEVARHMVGFGVPASSEVLLEGQDHEITLVFASRLMPHQELRFDFQWPAELVSPDGKCRGDIRQTLVYTPPLDYNFGAEFVRVSLDASLQQEKKRTPDGRSVFRREVHPTYLQVDEGDPHYEADLVVHGLKWSPIKVYRRRSLQGFGESSTWRLMVTYLTRAMVEVPPTGIPFTLILTISDPQKGSDVFNSMRQSLQTLGARLSDIRTAARVTPRI